MRLTLKDHRDAMVAMLANGNCPTSAARLAHAMHDVLSYLQSEPEAPVSHSERRDEATTPGLNDKLLALDVGALAKPKTVNKRVRKLEATVKARDNTVNQLKENIQLLRDERVELTRQLQEALDREQCLQDARRVVYAGPLAGPKKETRQPSCSHEWVAVSALGEEEKFMCSACGIFQEEDTEMPWIEWEGGECPVRDGAVVGLKFYDNTEWCGTTATNFDWYHRSLPNDIIAYRVVKP